MIFSTVPGRMALGALCSLALTSGVAPVSRVARILALRRNSRYCHSGHRFARLAGSSGLLMQPVRILVVDDHPIVRAQICALLRAESDFSVVCDVADGNQAVAKASELQPDIVVLDITMPGMDGFEAARRIRKVAPSAEILFLSQHDSLETIRQAFRSGGRGYVVKSDAAKELVAAVRTVSEKKQYMNARFVEQL